MNPEDLYENFLQESLGELKDYLSLRGLSVTGKKRELVARAFSACERNVRVVVSDEELRSRPTVEYQQRIKSLPRDPRLIAEDEWRNYMTTWPALDLGKVFSFILSKKEFDSDYVGKYKVCKAYSFFASGFVDTLYSHTFVTIGEYILKCKVTPSQRVRDEPWEVWVAIDTNWGGGGVSCLHGVAAQQATPKVAIMLWHFCTKWSMQFLWASLILHVYLYHADGMTACLEKMSLRKSETEK